jgi:ABC-type tungstate transport system substrate-binding protein
VLNTLLAVPSVVVGLVVYLLLSRSARWASLGWLFSFQAMVLAQVLLVLPVCTALTRQVVEDAERANGEQLQSLGAGRCCAACCWCSTSATRCSPCCSPASAARSRKWAR